MAEAVPLEEVELVIPGDPVPMQRAGRGQYGQTYIAHKSKGYRERIRAAWLVEGRPRLPDVPLECEATFLFARPPSHVRADGRIRKGKPAAPRADNDNLEKAIWDALQDEAGARWCFRNDAQIVRNVTTRDWAQPGEEGHAVVVLRVRWPVG